MDSTTRQAERLAATGEPEAQRQALVQHMRTWQHVPTTCPHCDRVATRVEVVCVPCSVTPQASIGPGFVCASCPGTGRAPWEWPDRLTLMAYAGDPAARELVGADAGLPWPACDCAGPDPRDPGGPGPCLKHSPPSHFRAFLAGLSRWPGAPLVASLGAAWAWLSTLECAHDGKDEHGCWDCKNTGYDNAEGSLAEAALTTATEHARCGCEASREAWANEFGTLGLDDRNLWIPYPTDRFEECCREVAQRLGEPTTRAAVQAALVGWALRGEVPS